MRWPVAPQYPPGVAAFVALVVAPLPVLFVLAVWRGQYTVDVWYAGVAFGVVAMWLLTTSAAAIAGAAHAGKYVLAALLFYGVGAGVLYGALALVGRR